MNNKLYEDVNDSELLMLCQENDEDAKNILFNKYRFIIDYLIGKYWAIWSKLDLDYQDLYSECTIGFSDGISSYSEDKNVQLSSFLSLCVERRLQSILRKYHRAKKFGVYSLDFIIGAENRTLKDFLSDDWEHDPLKNITEEEDYYNLFKTIESKLTIKEKETFDFLTKGFNCKEIAEILGVSSKQVDNSIQRIKYKVRKILDENEKNMVS